MRLPRTVRQVFPDGPPENRARFFEFGGVASLMLSACRLP